MYLVVFYGVLGRGIRHSYNSHKRHILDVLKKKNIQYDVLVVNNNIGDEIIDGVQIDNDDYKIIEYDKYIELKQVDIDNVVKMTYPDYNDFFINDKCYVYEYIRKNVMRQSYIEHIVSQNLDECYDKVIVVCSDFKLSHDLPLDNILNNDSVVVSHLYPFRGGFTDGLYMGSTKSVKLVLNHFPLFYEFLKKGKLAYEWIISRSFEHHNVSASVKKIFFKKLRATDTN